tara:strand:- start:1575 stop:2099 length:525 start_codon:yes stop_codon:yes gene_type:complete
MVKVNKNINETRLIIWNEIKESFSLCKDIGIFDPSGLCIEDIPRIIHKGKVVFPDSIFNKINKMPNKDSELYQFSLESLAILAGLKLNLDEKFSIILGKSYSCIYAKRSSNDSSQFEQLFFSSKFLKEFGVDYKWNIKDEKLKKFIKLMFNTILEWSINRKKHIKDINDFKNSL